MDGENFIKFNHDESNSSSISGNSITCIYEDSQKNLWFGTTQGLNRYDPATQILPKDLLFIMKVIKLKTVTSPPFMKIKTRICLWVQMEVDSFNACSPRSQRASLILN